MAALQPACADSTAQRDTSTGALTESFEYALTFRPTVNGEDFGCGTQYEDIGMAGAKIRAVDARLWLHDLELVREGGEVEPLVLDESRPTRTIQDNGAWQKDGVALLDFEDASAGCTGTPETRYTVVGTAPKHDDYVGLRFKVGVPERHNHIDPTVAEYPLGAPGMSWQWKTGYRFVRIDVETEKFPKFYFHLGATGCEGAIGSFACSTPNIPEIELDGFTPGESEIEADLATLYDELDVNAAGEKTTACMSGGVDNPLCPSMFGAFGLEYGDSPAPEQRFFRVR